MMQLVADDIGLQVMLTLSPVLVRGDPGLLSQMFANLFENAIKYGAEGGVVEIGLSSAKGLAVLTVADRGLGIPEASREAIFLPGRRLDRGRVEEGYGYGLAFVRTVVLAHGGKIRVEDARPGARFVVELPLAAPTLAMAGREDRSPSHSKSGSARALARP